MLLYDSQSSGNAYKVRLLLALLGRAYERVEMDTDAGATRTPAFLELNPNGRIPLLVCDDGRRLPESNAILYYLATDTRYLPADPWPRAQALQWMFFEQYSHEPNIAVARFWRHYIWDEKAGDPYWERALAERMTRGREALAVMERHLSTHDFFAAGHYTIADIALYAYTHVADEGGFDLGPYPAVRAWLDRVADQPGHVLISQSEFA